MREGDLRLPAPGHLAMRLGEATVGGDLLWEGHEPCLVMFVHGSGSSRFSPRNQQVARAFHEAGYATLLFDLLTAGEDEEDRRTARPRFDIELLTRRVVAAVDWVRSRPAMGATPIVLFGASTGAAAALRAAALRPGVVAGVISRGGRPDLAGPALAQVRVPTCLIVGGRDTAVLSLNRGAYEHLRCERSLEVVAGAGHLFEEPGTLARVVAIALTFLERHVGRRALPARPGP